MGAPWSNPKATVQEFLRVELRCPRDRPVFVSLMAWKPCEEGHDVNPYQKWATRLHSGYAGSPGHVSLGFLSPFAGHPETGNLPDGFSGAHLNMVAHNRNASVKCNIATAEATANGFPGQHLH